jgi:hypothetical protein
MEIGHSLWWLQNQLRRVAYKSLLNLVCKDFRRHAWLYGVGEKMKMKVFDPETGAPEGWFIALCETVIVFGLLVTGFFYEPVRVAWQSMGGFVSTIYPLSFGSWLGYKAISKVWGKPKNGQV